MTVEDTRGAISAGHRLTAEAGALMLREGGTAIDAAIAALAMACVCEPVLASPGGGGFAMVRDGATGKVSLLDFFPQTPKTRNPNTGDGFRHITADFGTATQVFHIGPATVATPGFFPGLEALAAKGAKLSFRDHFGPAITAARNGFEITPYQAYLSTVVEPILIATGPARELFAPDGSVQAEGQTFRNPGLGDAFERVAELGWEHSGIIPQMLKQQTGCGHLKEADFAEYEVAERDPVNLNVRGSEVFLNALPAASGALIQYALKQLNDCEPLSLAHALHAADLARVDQASDLSKLLDRPLRQKGTTHISVVDSAGNACAVTVSNGTGNGELVDGFGFMPNNILGEEDVNPHGADDWPLDCRLASMMCPTLLTRPDGALVALGSGGSNRIRSAIFQTVARLCHDGDDLLTAVEAPRLHVENGHVDIENCFYPKITEPLLAAFPDHRLWPERNMFFGGVHAVAYRDDVGFSGVGDRRRDGVTITV